MASQETQQAASSTAINASQLFREFDEFPWATDPDFQKGLQTVLSQVQNSTADGAEQEIEYRAKSFFFERKTGYKIDLDAFKSWKHAQVQEKSAGGETSAVQTEETPFPSKYAAIVELILSGKPVPGIKDIPDTVLGQDAASESTTKQRRKPWETDSIYYSVN